MDVMNTAFLKSPKCIWSRKYVNENLGKLGKSDHMKGKITAAEKNLLKHDYIGFLPYQNVDNCEHSKKYQQQAA